MIGVKKQGLKDNVFFYKNVRFCLFFSRINLMAVLIFLAKEEWVFAAIIQLELLSEKLKFLIN